MSPEVLLASSTKPSLSGMETPTLPEVILTSSASGTREELSVILPEVHLAVMPEKAPERESFPEVMPVSSFWAEMPVPVICPLVSLAVRLSA